MSLAQIGLVVMPVMFIVLVVTGNVGLFWLPVVAFAIDALIVRAEKRKHPDRSQWPRWL